MNCPETFSRSRLPPPLAQKPASAWTADLPNSPLMEHEDDFFVVDDHDDHDDDVDDVDRDEPLKNSESQNKSRAASSSFWEIAKSQNKC